MTEPIDERCRLSPEGVEVCVEIESRREAIRLADELGLPHAGLDRAIDLHLRGLQLHDGAER